MRPLLFLILFLTTRSGMGQSENLINYTSFFQQQVGVLNEWLKLNSISDSLLFANEVVVDSNKATLFISLKDWANWDELNRRSEKELGQPFGDLLFEKYIFLSDLEKSQLSIEIEGLDAFVFLDFKEGEILEDIMEKMGEISDSHLIPFKDISGASVFGSASSGISTDTVKIKLEIGLKSHFEGYEAFFENYKFEVLSRLNNELVIDIFNVVDVILDEGYFERIRLTFDFTQKDENLNIDYSIAGKYGAGIIWAPKSSDYYDMSLKYPEELERFNLKLKNKIDQLVKN